MFTPSLNTLDAGQKAAVGSRVARRVAEFFGDDAVVVPMSQRVIEISDRLAQHSSRKAASREESVAATLRKRQHDMERDDELRGAYFILRGHATQAHEPAARAGATLALAKLFYDGIGWVSLPDEQQSLRVHELLSRAAEPDVAAALAAVPGAPSFIDAIRDGQKRFDDAAEARANARAEKIVARQEASATERQWERAMRALLGQLATAYETSQTRRPAVELVVSALDEAVAVARGAQSRGATDGALMPALTSTAPTEPPARATDAVADAVAGGAPRALGAEREPTPPAPAASTLATAPTPAPERPTETATETTDATPDAEHRATPPPAPAGPVDGPSSVTS